MRSAKNGAYTSREQEFFKTLQPLVKKAFDLRLKNCLPKQLENLPGNPLMLILDKLHLGVVLVDALGMIAYKNHTARDIFAQNDGLTVDNGHLKFRRTRDANRFSAIIKDLVNGQVSSDQLAEKTVQEMKSNSGKRIFITVVPLFDQGRTGHQSPTKPGDYQFGIILTGSCTNLQLSYGSLHALFGITPAEYEVARHLVKGWTQSEIAAFLGKGRGTVKSNVDDMKHKTGTSRQSDLVCLLSRCPAVLRLDD